MKDSLILKPISYISGKITLPGSKSISNRVLLLSSLSKGSTKITNLLNCDDVKYMLNALNTLGISFKIFNKNTECLINGIGGPFILKKKIKLFLGNAGTAIRPLLSILSIGSNDVILTGEPRMMKRPIKHLVEALRQGGGNINYLGEEGFPPIVTKGGFTGGKITLNGTISSQFLSALLISSPMSSLDTTIKIKGNLVSKSYVKLTIHLMGIFGIFIYVSENYDNFFIKGNQKYKSPGEYFIEGDASSATYFLAASAIKGGSVEVFGINKSSIQGDSKFSNILEKMGSEIIWKKNSIICKRKNLYGIDVDLNDMPDAAMTIAIMGLFSSTPVYVRNIFNWKLKETDRLNAMFVELKKIGAKVKIGTDYIIVYPKKSLKSSVINTYNDHRIAMCFSLVALSGLPITINNPSCVNKTFPNYFKLFNSICHYN